MWSNPRTHGCTRQKIPSSKVLLYKTPDKYLMVSWQRRVGPTRVTLISYTWQRRIESTRKTQKTGACFCLGSVFCSIYFFYFKVTWFTRYFFLFHIRIYPLSPRSLSHTLHTCNHFSIESVIHPSKEASPTNLSLFFEVDWILITSDVLGSRKWVSSHECRHIGSRRARVIEDRSTPDNGRQSENTTVLPHSHGVCCQASMTSYFIVSLQY